jgi:N-acetylated-alpha-linked acidic dipeptidase
MTSARRLALIAGFSLSALIKADLAGAQTQSATTPTMLGFSADGAAREAAIEAQFDTRLSPGDQKAWLEKMSAAPNQVGSPHDHANALWQLAQFKAWGWDAHIETFQVLYPTPISESLELVGPTPFRATLHEPAIAGDPSSADMPGVLPPYVAYQGDGDVTAPLVYVNYGMPDDYKALARQGIDVKGKIVIARYGSGWRGLKPKLAQAHGAVGCIIYSDPKDDGYFTDDAYPKGPQRPSEGVQRGSVQDITHFSGDPLTPGVAATPQAHRLTRAQATNILKIPTLPISYADAEPLLAALGGPVANVGFRGALPITYHIGPGPAVVHLVVQSEWSLKPIYDVIAVMKGAKYPDQWVVRGNHHDGWVFGAEDPLSGQVALMDEARSIGALAKTGWRPARTLVYASWDGEEPGLLGSTEWAEAHADELKTKAVLYLNSDGNGRGFLFAGGSHDYQDLVNQVAQGVKDPETGVSLQARLRARARVNGLNPPSGGGEEGADRVKRLAKAAEAGGALPIEALGSGSDYTPFLQHLGLAALDLAFGGESEGGGVYHSAYDTYTHYERFGDPTFQYGVALAQTAGHIMLRTADAETPPLRFTDFADTVGEYLSEVHSLADKARDKTAKDDALIAEGDYKLAADPTKVELPPPANPPVPALALAPLDKAVARLKLSAKTFDQAYGAALASGPLPPVQASKLNTVLQGIDETLLSAEGLPGRPWYANLVYAPGLETGYGVKTLPGVREGIEGRRWGEADHYAALTAAVLNAFSDRLDQASALLGAKPVA